ncbi:hypothetical protein BJ508DRAFT_417122 [Ascobolus immersus RN42]|uniref:Uncharacterized protein n=1 Tax=Ascobolus immersus RN42 TaxID=1160509 RepID=A0A3N4HZY1_ASCIM|nr:hypothetical protein BJ508DRAFT_417122 [Ascobolus immersus RN42]
MSDSSHPHQITTDGSKEAYDGTQHEISAPSPHAKPWDTSNLRRLPKVPLLAFLALLAICAFAAYIILSADNTPVSEWPLGLPPSV